MKKSLLPVLTVCCALAFPAFASAASPLEEGACLETLYIPSNTLIREMMPVMDIDAINNIVNSVNAVPVSVDDISLPAVRKVFMRDHVEMLQAIVSKKPSDAVNYANTRAEYKKYALKQFPAEERAEIDFLFAIALSHSPNAADHKTAYRLIESCRNAIESGNMKFRLPHRLIFNDLAFELKQKPLPFEAADFAGNMEPLVRWQTAYAASGKKDWTAAEKAYLGLSPLIYQGSYTSQFISDMATQWLATGLHNDGWYQRESQYFENIDASKREEAYKNVQATLTPKTESEYPVLNLARFYTIYAGIPSSSPKTLEKAFVLLNKIKPEQATELCASMLETQDKLKFASTAAMKQNIQVCLSAFQENYKTLESPSLTYQIVQEYYPGAMKDADKALLSLISFDNKQSNAAFDLLTTTSSLQTVPESVAKPLAGKLPHELRSRFRTLSVQNAKCHPGLDVQTTADNQYLQMIELARKYNPDDVQAMNGLQQAFKIHLCQLDSATDFAFDHPELLEETLKNYAQNGHRDQMIRAMNKLAALTPDKRDELVAKNSKLIAEQVMLEAENRISSGKYQEALNILNSLGKAWPLNEGKDRLLFLSAQSLNGLKKFNDAVNYLIELQNSFPKSEYADDALFHAIVIAQSHNMKDKAAELTEIFKKNYPESDYYYHLAIGK